MKRSFGLICIFLGLAMLLGALALYLRNEQEDRQAEQSVELYLPQIKDAIADHVAEQALINDSFNSRNDSDELSGTSQEDERAQATTAIPIDPNYYSTEMTVEIIDGYGFVGYLTIPSLELQMPVLSEMDYDRLKLSPCRFYGSTKTDDLVIGAHNYSRLFGQISNMRVGAEVHFTDMDGKTWSYRLVEMITLKPNDAHVLTNGEYPLTLFTCTFGGGSRVTLRFDLIKD